MTTALFITGSGSHYARVRELVSGRLTTFDADPGMMPPGTAPSRVDVVFLDAEHLTDDLVADLRFVRVNFRDATVVAVASEHVVRQVQDERIPAPDQWILIPASDVRLQAAVDSLVAYLTAKNVRAPEAPVPSAPHLGGVLDMDSAHRPRGENTISRAVSRMAGSLDIHKLYDACCDALSELTGCVSFCLLRYDPTCRGFKIVRAEGLHPSVESSCVLSVTGPLANHLQRVRGLVTMDALAGVPEGSEAIRELELCGGVLAVPVLSRGVLQGLIVLGPKAIGGPYRMDEAESLLMLAASFASAVRVSELHNELQSRNNYIDQVLSTMASGVITLQMDGTIVVCNPNAAEVLGLGADSVVGRDMRVLPAPLGDHLYACLRYGEERSREEVTILAGTRELRIWTRRLLDENNQLIGSMMLVEDISAEKALAQEKRKAERNEVISQIVARFAHELKNPLATIRTFTELLPSRYEDPEFREFWAEHVRRDVHRLDDLVNKLVSIADPPETTRELTDVSELLQLAVERVLLLDEHAAQRIQTLANGALPPVNVDSNAMAAAIAHLLRYSVGPNRQNVTVKAELQDGPEGEQPVAIYIRTPVEDIEGMDPRSVLEPSYVIDHPDIDLGPSASQRLVESQGGALDAYRDKNEMVFRISLIPVAQGRDLTLHKRPG